MSDRDPDERIYMCERCGVALAPITCPYCEGSGLEFGEYCPSCDGSGVEWACPVCDVDEENIEPEPTRDELLQALREAWGDVLNGRTHILHDFTDFFTNMLGEE